jgi:succinate dehydrogenase flavin-adding protein (antitoxin of CptAB toxin-antitoxin module)
MNARTSRSMCPRKSERQRDAVPNILRLIHRKRRSGRYSDVRSARYVSVAYASSSSSSSSVFVLLFVLEDDDFFDLELLDCCS